MRKASIAAVVVLAVLSCSSAVGQSKKVASQPAPAGLQVGTVRPAAKAKRHTGAIRTAAKMAVFPFVHPVKVFHAIF